MLKFCVAGDIILMEDIPAAYRDEAAGLERYIHDADIRIANMETTITQDDAFASTFCGGTWLTAPPSILDSLDRYRFQYYSFANNHTMDYSYGGLSATLNSMRAHNVLFGGAGMNLAEATRHTLLRSPAGDVAVISVSATCDDAARAGDPGDRIPGRPGLNMLRHREVFTVNRAHMQALTEIADATNINGRINNSKRGGYTLSVPGEFQLGSLFFKEGETEGKHSIPNAADEQRIVRAIEEARKETPRVVIVLHSHEIKGSTDDEPDFFVESFAHRCVDAGAAAVICSGSHQIKAVETYQGAPIFYSIANFIFQSDDTDKLPMDYYEKYSVDPAWSAREAIAVRSANGTRGLQTDINNYLALVPTLHFEGERVRSVAIQPIELLFDAPHGMKGLPRVAEGAAFERIRDCLIRLSDVYGTKFSVSGNQIMLEL